MSRFFDGVDDSVNCGSAGTLDDIGARTIAFWMNPRASSSGVVQYKGSGAANGENGIELLVTSQISYFRHWAGAYMIVKSVNNSLTNGKWQFICITEPNSFTATNCHIYVDNVEVAYSSQSSGSGASVSDAAGSYYWGNTSDNSKDYNGKLAYCQTFNRVLTMAEMKQIRLFPGSIRNGLKGFWPFVHEGSSQPDLSGNLNHGRSVSSVYNFDDPLLNLGFVQPREFGFTYPLARSRHNRLRRWMGGIQFDAASNSGYQAASSTFTWSHTCTGANRYLTVGVSMLSVAQSVSSITYSGVAMTLIGTRSSVSGAARVELWGLIAPATGTNDIVVTLTGAIAWAGNASSYTGIHQDSPIEAFSSAQATNVGAADATVDVTTVADNDWCVDILATDDAAVTAGAGQTATGNVSGVGGSGTMSYEGPKTPSGAVTMSWTNVGALATWAIGSVALRPVAAVSLLTGRLLQHPGMSGRMQDLVGLCYG